MKSLLRIQGGGGFMLNKIKNQIGGANKPLDKTDFLKYCIIDEFTYPDDCEDQEYFNIFAKVVICIQDMYNKSPKGEGEGEGAATDVPEQLKCNFKRQDLNAIYFAIDEGNNFNSKKYNELKKGDSDVEGENKLKDIQDEIENFCKKLPKNKREKEKIKHYKD